MHGGIGNVFPGPNGGSVDELDPSGPRLVTSPETGVARTDIWDVERRRLITHIAGIRATNASWTADGSRVVIIAAKASTLGTGNLSRGVVVIDSTRRAQRTAMRAPAARCGGFVYSAISDDGRRVVATAECGDITEWDADTGRRLRELHTHAGVGPLALNHDGSLLAVGTADSRGQIWALSPGRLVRTLIGHTQYVDLILFSPRDDRVLTGSPDETLRVWDTHTGRIMHVIPEEGAFVNAVFSPDGRRIAAAGSDGTVRIRQTCQACGDAKALLALARPRVTPYPTRLERYVLGHD